MAKSVRKNYFYNLLYEIVVLVVPLITAPYLSRVLGADGVGVSSYTLSIVSYFILIANVGTTSYGAREIAMARDNKKDMSKETKCGIGLCAVALTIIGGVFGIKK